jgi:glycosyltransferase involved in cell wall biosynthesis
VTSRPLLIISDAPSGNSGLARITRDLATFIADESDLDLEFRVATLGNNGTGSSQLPWMQYNMNPTTDWLITELPEVLNDFVRDGERPILFTIWDSTRLSWLANPALCPHPRLRRMVEERNFDLWGYFPLDADTFHGNIGLIARETISKFDRVLTYSDWAAKVIMKSIQKDWVADWVKVLPHGISTTFTPRPRTEARSRFQGLPDDALLVGIVATNQARKDWPLGLEVVAELQHITVRPVYVWIHTDTLSRPYAWDIYGILHELHLVESAIITDGNMSDEEMSYMYSACDVTLGIGAGEGFGYPIFESLACGTPCVHGNYAGAAEYMPQELLVSPIAYRYDGPLANRRPVFAVREWVEVVEKIVDRKIRLPATLLPHQLRWDQLWPRFEAWLREGL